MIKRQPPLSVIIGGVDIPSLALPQPGSGSKMALAIPPVDVILGISDPYRALLFPIPTGPVNHEITTSDVFREKYSILVIHFGAPVFSTF